MLTRYQKRLPRFQFFYKTHILLLSFIRLSFENLNKRNMTSQFLNRMKVFFGRKEAHLVSSYRMGLFFTLKSLGLKPGDEVLLTPITIADSINAIKLLGLTPVLVDLDPETHSVSLEDLGKKVSPESKVLIVTYLSGIVPDIDQIKECAASYNLVLIEDISQNVDSTFKGKKVGSHADVSIASLSCGKNISSLYGGLILSDDENLMARVRKESETLLVPSRRGVLGYYLLNCIKVQIATSRIIFPYFVYPLIKLLSSLKGRYPLDFNHDPVIPNNIFASSSPVLRKSFPDEFYTYVNDWQLSIVQHQLEILEEGTRKRRMLAASLIKNLSEASLKFIPAALLKNEENNYYHFPIYAGGRKSELRKHLFLKGFDNGSYGLNLCSEEEELGLTSYKLINAEKIKHDSIFLPIHEDYCFEQMENLARTVNEFFEDKSRSNI